MNVARNFFKHADRDSDQALEFRPEIPEFVLFDCRQMYHSYTGRHLLVARDWRSASSSLRSPVALLPANKVRHKDTQRTSGPVSTGEVERAPAPIERAAVGRIRSP